MKKDTLLTIAVLGLLVLNIALVIIFYVNQGKRPFMPPPPRGNEHPDKVIIDRLKFDETQQKEFENLKDEHRQKVRALEEKSRRLHDELFAQLKEPEQDPGKVTQIISSIGENRKQFEQATYDHFAAIKALCKTDEQKKLFDDFIDELGKMVGPPPQQPGMNQPPREQRPPHF